MQEFLITQDDMEMTDYKDNVKLQESLKLLFSLEMLENCKQSIVG